MTTVIHSAVIAGEAEFLLLRILDGLHLVGIASDGPGGSAEAVLELRLCRSHLERLCAFGVEREDAEMDDTDLGDEDLPHDDDDPSGGSVEDEPHDDIGNEF